MRKDRYLYPALFDYVDDGISVSFPDLPGCLTFGDSDEEAVAMAKEALSLHLYGMEEDGDLIPTPSPVQHLDTAENQALVFIEVWMPPFRLEMRNQSVKKTLTIPRWLDAAAKEHKVNYSVILQDALKAHLGVHDDLSSK